MSSDQFAATEEKQRLLAHLQNLGIEAPIVAYPEHATVAEGKLLRGDLPGTFTKNLLLKDKRGRLFFITAFEDTEIDLKTLHTRIGGRGRLGFASAEVMQDVLHVTPGTATPLSLVNDTDQLVTLVIDKALDAATQLNFHPMVQAESIGLTPEQFATFISSCGREPLRLALEER